MYQLKYKSRYRSKKLHFGSQNGPLHNSWYPNFFCVNLVFPQCLHVSFFFVHLTISVSAQSLCDSIQQRTSKQTGLFLNSLPDYILKGLFPTSANYQDDGHHQSDQNLNDIPDIVKEFLPLACIKGDVDVVLVLLNFGADPKLKGEKVSHGIDRYI